MRNWYIHSFVKASSFSVKHYICRLVNFVLTKVAA